MMLSLLLPMLCVSSMNCENVFVSFSNTNGDACHKNVSFAVALVLVLRGTDRDRRPTTTGRRGRSINAGHMDETCVAVMLHESALKDVTGLPFESELEKVTDMSASHSQKRLELHWPRHCFWRAGARGAGHRAPVILNNGGTRPQRLLWRDLFSLELMHTLSPTPPHNGTASLS